VLLLLTLGLTWAYFTRQPAPDARVMKSSILPPENSSFDHIAISPDGRHLAFTAATGGKVQLWVRALDSSEARVLVGTQGAAMPFWSPDSRFIGFFADGRLKKIEVTGGLALTLCEVPGPSFDGAWSRPFERELTAPAPFTRPDGTTVLVPTMHGGASGHFEDDEVQAMRLDYGAGDLAFVAVIAREGLAAPALDEHRWAEIAGGLRERPGRLALPRLRLSCGLELRPALSALGLAPLFGDGAELDGIFEGPAPAAGAGRVLHRARVDLDEHGTRAAAVTVVTVRAVSMPVEEPFDLRLDRPFTWAIEHRESGTLLFLGRVTDPSRT